ncbi:coiled-coil domain-containing protein 189 isoform X1 [Takifugu flavidus]|uniref:coiled-coil domain-containing protein 189 isoform X1 n=1 Tax=Takifugu flavidus TaxID=433684 RepID=UPI002544436B|nr:coiled-coil domain-containing protein 189 isoform X1 [Takifugu flavidus]XP_056890223.1 coiled-coil domain-containing protein 189 isoform X1 [Takifugu flavidus]
MDRRKVSPAMKAKVLLWADVSYHDMDEINKVQSVPDLERFLTNIYPCIYTCSHSCRHRCDTVLPCDRALSTVFEVDLLEPRRGVLLELYVQAVFFCREQNFKNEQTSVLLSILKSIHQANIGSPHNNIESCFKYCKELLICHSVRRPPFSIELFSLGEVTAILKYINNNYLRHYKFYKYLFTQQVKLDLSLTYPGISDQKVKGVKNVMVKQEALQVASGSPRLEDSTAATGSKSELKMLIEKEVREQLALISGQLDQQMKKTTERYNRVVETSKPKQHE